MRYKKCPKCKGTMMVIDDRYRCAQCSYEPKTKEEIKKLEGYNSKQEPTSKSATKTKKK